MYTTTLTYLIAGLATAAHTFSIPANLQKFYDDHKSVECSNKLASGFQPTFGGADRSAEYCGDVPGVIFGHSSGNSGKYWDMDVDCDGANRQAGKCANDPTGQGMTAFKTQVNQLSGLSDLDANLHPYVVFGNSEGSPSFDPIPGGMQPLSVMAVVCNNQLYYGIWGDTNGGTTTGEASISLADLCFPDENLTGDNGHNPTDVLYIGFIGGDTAPVGAKWNAGNTAEFSESIRAVGESLVARL